MKADVEMEMKMEMEIRSESVRGVKGARNMRREG